MEGKAGMGNNRSITGRQLFGALGALGAMGVAAVGAGLLGGCSSSRSESSPQADETVARYASVAVLVMSVFHYIRAGMSRRRGRRLDDER